MAIVQLRFTNPDTDSDLTRSFFAGVEATALQVAGVDGGRVLGTGHVQLVSPGVDDQALRAVGDTTYAYMRASLTSSSGPWTNVSTGSLAVAAGEGVTVDVWYQAVAKRWASATPIVRPSFSFRLGATRPVGWAA